MKMITLTPNQSRIVYDMVVALLGASFVVAFTYLVMDFEPTLTLFLTPVLLFVCNWSFGIFSKFRVGSGWIKTPILTASVVCSAAVVIILSGDVASSILWGAMVWAPIVLPRIFLNFNTRLKTDIVSSTMKKRGPVLVVGGGGYIGSHLVDQLLAEGNAVRVLDRFIYGKEPLSDFLDNPRLEIIEGDATDIMKLVIAMNGVSAVVHLGGLVGDPACSIDETFTRHANVIATRMVKEVAISMGIPRFIFASSCSVYGSNEKEVDETSELNPVSLYAKTKIDSENELLNCVDETFCPVLLRFATVFGHSRRPRFDLVGNLFVAQAVTNGEITVVGKDQWRPFVHVKDLARAIVMVLKAPEDKVRGQIFNVGDSKMNLTIGDLGKLVHKIVSKEQEVKISIKNDISDTRNYFVSFDKIKKIIGFQCSIFPEAGLQEILQEFRKGSYASYQHPNYSNLQMTKKAVAAFRDPVQSSRLYQPRNEEVISKQVINE